MGKKARLQALVKELRLFYKKSGRGHLPWRTTRDPYHILVSEVMLQQTQVGRVVPFYKKFIKKFPTARALARAPLRDVLKSWNGLGYNRRAKYLHETAKIIARDGFVGQKLPGVGPYTAGAIAAFAFNRPEVFIETNIRTVFIYSGILQKTRIVSDKALLPCVAEALEASKMQPRDFYAALMDYGAYLKRQGVRLNSRSAQYVKQSKFEGSPRQLRGAILRELLQKSMTLAQLKAKLSRTSHLARGELERELTRLTKDGLLTQARRRYHVAG